MNMETILFWLDISTAVWLASWTLRAVSRLCAGEVDTVNIVIPVHFFFFGLPLALDHLIGRPPLSNWPGFAAALQDPASCFVYDAYMAFCPVIMWLVSRSGRGRVMGPGVMRRSISEKYKPLLIGIAISPLVALCFAPNPAIYSEYASVLNQHTPSEQQFHTLLSNLIFLSIFAAAGLLYSARNAGATFAAIAPLLFTGIWLNGKRSIVIITILVIGAAVLARIGRRLGPTRIIATAVILGSGFALYSYTYQARFRTLETLDFNSSYQNMRLDYGRDLVTKMVLMHELNRPDLSILEYRGQSLFFNTVMYFPREEWPDKPWPYAVYATAAALRFKVAYIGWGITTSWFDECIANMGWVGMLVAPISIGLVCRAGDRSGDPVLRSLTIAVTLLLLTVQFAAWHPLGYFWLISLYLANSQNRAKSVPRLLLPRAGVGITSRFATPPLTGTNAD
jgi:hypothetical protein